MAKRSSRKPKTKLASGQCAHIFAKFGGSGNLWRALAEIGKEYNRLTIAAWNKPKDKGGTGGIILNGTQWHVERAAQHVGVTLTEADWDPARPA